jgi:hypothetical protein
MTGLFARRTRALRCNRVCTSTIRCTRVRNHVRPRNRACAHANRRALRAESPASMQSRLRACNPPGARAEPHASIQIAFACMQVCRARGAESPASMQIAFARVQVRRACVQSRLRPRNLACARAIRLGRVQSRVRSCNSACAHVLEGAFDLRWDASVQQHLRLFFAPGNVSLS